MSVTCEVINVVETIDKRVYSQRLPSASNFYALRLFRTSSHLTTEADYGDGADILSDSESENDVSTVDKEDKQKPDDCQDESNCSANVSSVEKTAATVKRRQRKLLGFVENRTNVKCFFCRWLRLLMKRIASRLKMSCKLAVMKVIDDRELSSSSA